ncbi:hypothetical protein C9988_02810 [Pseudidiomarina aestuarii]|nr:hypothetical protein C9988_02810 [Pseudidiomarina aestuarii]
MLCLKLRYILLSACIFGSLTTPAASGLASELELAPNTPISQLQVGSEILIELTNQSESFRVEQTILNDSGSRTVIAKPVTGGSDGFYIGTFYKDYKSITMVVDGQSYFEDSFATQGLVVSDIQKQFSTAIGNWPRAIVQPDGHDADKLMKEWAETAAATDDTATIDIHFHFNELVQSHYGEALQARIDHIVNATNMFFEASDIHLKVAAKSSFMDNPHRPSRDMLGSYLFFEYGKPAEYDFRTLHGHDVVLLLNLNFAPEYGCAFTSNVNPLIENYSAHAVGVVSIDCPDESLARAIATTLGVQRSHYSGIPENSTFDFGFGHGEKGKFYTMMPNRDDFLTSSNPLPQKVYRFSSPLTQCEGSPCGIAEGEPLAADAVRAVNLVRFAAANSNTPIQDKRHFNDLIEDVPDRTLRNCLEHYRFDKENPRSSYVSTWGDSLICSSPIQDLTGIGAFTSFTTLAINVRSGDMSELAKLTSLKHLQIEGDRNTWGTDAFGELINLETLVIEGLHIENPEVLNKLVKLRELTFLSRRQDFRDVQSLGGMTSLEKLILEAPMLDNLDIFSEISTLQYVKINQSQITSLAPMGNWKSKPTYVDFNRNQIVGSKGLEAHPQLEFLHLESNHNLGDLDGLRHSNELLELTLFGSAIRSFAPISQLPKLRKLSLSSNDVTHLDDLPPFNDLYSIKIYLLQGDDAGPLLLKVPKLLANAERFGQRAGIGYSLQRAPCWQRDYFVLLNEHDVFDNIYVTGCRPVGYDLDYDSDGMSNRDEIQLRRNPLIAETPETQRKALDLIDFDADQKSDLLVRNPSTFFNYGRTSHQNFIQRIVFGLSKADIPLVGDYDGDGISDLIMRRPSTSMWYINTSSDPGPRGDYIQRIRFGLQAEDVPFVADFDGDGRDDIGVYRSATRTWYLRTPSDPGLRGDFIQRITFPVDVYEQPFVGDFDGDGRFDVGLIQSNTGETLIYFSVYKEFYGTYGFTLEKGDIFVPADYDGDGITDYAYRRPSQHLWYIKGSIGAKHFSGTRTEITFGLNEEDIPIVADYDGDGLADIAVRRPSTSMQYILNSSGEPGPHGDGIQRIKFGLQQHYIPVAAPISIKMKMLAEQQ